MRVSEYLADENAVVRLKGVRVKMVDLHEDYDMQDCLAIKTPQGLLTVNSKPNVVARSIRGTRPAHLMEAPRRSYVKR